MAGPCGSTPHGRRLKECSCAVAPSTRCRLECAPTSADLRVCAFVQAQRVGVLRRRDGPPARRRSLACLTSSSTVKPTLLDRRRLLPAGSPYISPPSLEREPSPRLWRMQCIKRFRSPKPNAATSMSSAAWSDAKDSATARICRIGEIDVRRNPSAPPPFGHGGHDRRDRQADRLGGGAIRCQEAGRAAPG